MIETNKPQDFGELSPEMRRRVGLESPEDSGYSPRRPRGQANGPRQPARRGHGHGGHGHYSRHHHHYGCGHYGFGGYGFGFGFNPFRYRYGYSTPYYGYYAPYFFGSLYYGGYGHYEPDIYVGGGGGGTSRQGEAGMGALDLDVKPKKADVYLDGRLIGNADQFDGFPTYLWLEEGTYELAFYRQGYETLYLQYTLYPGVIVDVDYAMRKGKAELPQPPVGDYPVEPEAYDPEAAYEPTAPGPAADPDLARIGVTGSPADAAVYLDGHFVGTAGEIAQLSAGLIVEPGEHVIELVRPGFTTEQVTIEATGGEQVDLTLDLEAR